MLRNKLRGILRVDHRRVLNGIIWLLRSGPLARSAENLWTSRDLLLPSWSEILNFGILAAPFLLAPNQEGEGEQKLF